MCGQALVPFARLGIWDRFHEVSLQLTDAGVMPEQVLLRLIELLCRGKPRRERRCGWGREDGKEGTGQRDRWRKKTMQGQKVHGGWRGREREGRGQIGREGEINTKKESVFFVLGVFAQFCQAC